MTSEVRVVAPAKVNLSLAVGGLGADGYHPLATVYHAVGLHDEVVVRPAARLSLTVSGSGVDVDAVPTDDRNLAWRAVVALSEHVGRQLDVAVHVHKNIPVAGGLAGGSTDAAATLVALDALFELGLGRAALMHVAATLGSDVPFCLVGGTAVGTGRGELVAPVMTRGTCWWAVVPGAGGLSTPQVYGELDRLRAGAAGAAGVPEPEVPDALLTALRAGDPVRVGAALGNDLQAAALSLRPDLGTALEAGAEAGALASLVSGSGPTTVFLGADADHARDVRDQVVAATGARDGYVVPGPVPGAKVSAARIAEGPR